ncbi:MAG: preprotein translocase subunit SecY [Synergistaceae bacterium]|nr:preprotein translocase subunit SecY [Synergistaceae bacterium]MBQ3764118.1 preprotein translocase subunit SecY [Synergistaceae bacterium]MBQ4400816.1 preprotein translocase subunit SecY [Synergistaceae bacterium]MBQ6919611.1 preprotein translocase subunit SecY [Synergistaceae bacterium]MBQ6970016.1 preprotein translocase subunit SecY [Synergistaceae bacterium]
MFGSLGDIFRLPDLKRRILFTLFILFIFRLGAYIPSPGVDRAALANLFSTGGGMMDFLNLFSGGALSRFGIFSLGVAPYINSSIVMQLLVVIFPYLEKLQKDSTDGHKKITQWTRYGAVVFAIVQAIGMTAWLGSLGIMQGGFLDWLLVIVTLVAGSVAVMWLGEELSDHGIGNGISLLIFAGIVARVPEAILQTWSMVRLGSMSVIGLIVGIALMVVVVAGCILLQEGQRRLPVQYAKRVVGNKIYGGQSTFIPLKVNQSGVIPIIFASSLLIFPYTIANYFNESSVGRFFSMLFEPNSVFYIICYIALIIFFSYFYTAVVFNPTDIASNMKKYGGFILGIRPGQPTSDYITRVMERITLGGAVFLAIIALIPNLMSSVLGIRSFYFGGTAVLIVVGVAMDTVNQIEAQLLMRHYDGILKKSGSRRGLLRG